VIVVLSRIDWVKVEETTRLMIGAPVKNVGAAAGDDEKLHFKSRQRRL
jgi:hypothetical protein